MVADLQGWLEDPASNFGWIIRGDEDGFSTAMRLCSTEGAHAPALVITFTPPVSGCGSADFDCDGDTGTDFDIQAFFACLGGNCPAEPCANSADFDGDGDTGTDFDIQAFFRVLGGGPC
jgi:hypothetical protein